ncbi:hypothetical protein DSO57_1033838 [Entomophthora muscae]|nr:hypothetical protein DSO57_1033838 [Entomophthora muscae]
MLHSFSGSSETAKALKAQVSFSSKEMKIVNSNLIGEPSKPPSPEYSGTNGPNFTPPSLFYSLSELVNMRSEKKLEKLLSSISIDSILIESDCGSVHLVDEKLHNISSKCASILNMDTQTFLDHISDNNKSFFCN